AGLGGTVDREAGGGVADDLASGRRREFHTEMTVSIGVARQDEQRRSTRRKASHIPISHRHVYLLDDYRHYKPFAIAEVLQHGVRYAVLLPTPVGCTLLYSFSHCYGGLGGVPSFPTRRSSDLAGLGGTVDREAGGGVADDLASGRRREFHTEMTVSIGVARQD